MTIRLDRVPDGTRTVLNALVLLVLVAVVALFVAVAIPQAVGADQSYVVQSDSMSPTIKAGSVVFVDEVPAGSIQQGDVITFQRAGTDGPTTTHRVAEILERGGSRHFVTKGDANEERDPTPVPASAVVGVVTFHVPLVGYVIAFANTQLGLIALVVVPAAILVALEVRDLWRAASDDDSGEDGIL